MRRVLEALEPLNVAARKRVPGYVNDRIDAEAKEPAGTLASQPPLPGVCASWLARS